MGIEDADNLTEQVEDQIQVAVDSAQVVLFVVDCRDGPVPLDQEVGKRLRYVTAPVLLVVNKVDTPAMEAQANEFYRFGRKIVQVSVKENRGKAELLDAIRQRLPEPSLDDAPPVEPVMKVAIVGRRNVGKSTLVNTLAQAERMIVSEVPGTTRDSVDVRFELDGKAFMAIDTPGFRRTKSISTDVDFYSTHRAQRSIRRADVVLLFFDATQRISKVDKQLCDYIAQQYKPCMFVVNKWDLTAGAMPTEKWVAYLRDNFRTMWYAPIAFITGQSGKNVKAMLNHVADALPAVAPSRAHLAVEQADAGGDRPEPSAASTRTTGPRSIMPPRWPCSRPRSSSSAAIRRPSPRSTSATCCGCSATNWSSARCPSSSTSASASTATPATRSKPSRKAERMSGGDSGRRFAAVVWQSATGVASNSEELIAPAPPCFPVAV